MANGKTYTFEDMIEEYESNGNVLVEKDGLYIVMPRLDKLRDHLNRLASYADNDELNRMGLTHEEYVEKLDTIYNAVQHLEMDVEEDEIKKLFNCMPRRKDGHFANRPALVVYQPGITEIKNGNNGFDYYARIDTVLTLSCVDKKARWSWEDTVDTNNRIAVFWVDSNYSGMDKKSCPQILNLDGTVNEIPFEPVKKITHNNLIRGCEYVDSKNVHWIYIGDYVHYGEIHSWYVKLTKKIEKVISECKNLDEFIDRFLNDKEYYTNKSWKFDTSANLVECVRQIWDDNGIRESYDLRENSSKVHFITDEMDASYFAKEFEAKGYHIVYDEEHDIYVGFNTDEILTSDKDEHDYNNYNRKYYSIKKWKEYLNNFKTKALEDKNHFYGNDAQNYCNTFLDKMDEVEKTIRNFLSDDDNIRKALTNIRYKKNGGITDGTLIYKELSPMSYYKDEAFENHGYFELHLDTYFKDLSSKFCIIKTSSDTTDYSDAKKFKNFITKDGVVEKKKKGSKK